MDFADFWEKVETGFLVIVKAFSAGLRTPSMADEETTALAIMAWRFPGSLR